MQRIEITSGPPPEVIRDALTGNRRAKLPIAEEPKSKTPSRVDRPPIELPKVEVAEATAARSALPWIIGLSVGLTLAGVATLREPSASTTNVHRKQRAVAADGARDLEAAPRTTQAMDESGAVTRIEGKNPREVLEAFVASTAGNWEGVDLRPTEPHQRNTRLGILRRPGGGASEEALWIRFEEGSKRWFVGDGRKPVEPVPLDMPPP